MWDISAPLRMLESMPARLNAENLSAIQDAIDIDKYKNSSALGRDLCGEYAPFCELCDKVGRYPCAVAFVKMKQAEGMQVVIAEVEEAPAEAAEEAPAVAEQQAVEEVAPVEEIPEPAPARRIRIAIARRKHHQD